jgi:hypothetical protein
MSVLYGSLRFGRLTGKVIECTNHVAGLGSCMFEDDLRRRDVLNGSMLESTVHRMQTTP